MPAASESIAPLDESTWPLFAALVERNGGWPAGCWCLAFHEPVSGGQAARNRERKRELVRTGASHAALVLAEGECVGWCQFGPPAELPRIKSRAAYDRTAVRMPDWRIGCCFVGKSHRRQGILATGLAGALGLIAAHGGGVVEGYPEDAASVPSGFLYNGALSTYERLGFERDRMIGKHRWVVRREVAAEARPRGGTPSAVGV